MRIIVNAEPVELPENATAEDLIALRGLSEQACALEVNETLVPRKDRPDCLLQDGDRVEIVTLVGGG